MKNTQEQENIIVSKENTKVNATAGSGKTYTLIEYAKDKPDSAKILYLVFNKSVKEEAIEKFRAAKLYNVTVETAHSIAYKAIALRYRFKVQNFEPKPYELLEILDIDLNSEDDPKGTLKYTVVNHVKRLLSIYCNSAVKSIRDIDYISTLTNQSSINLFAKFAELIYSKAEYYWELMRSRKIECSHDFYLKGYQLTNPILDYDYLLFDEAQDASPVMLDVFLNQTATKLIVGDTHQQIYGWRFAVNSLETTPFEEKNLHTSFRFPQTIADLGIEVLSMKRLFNKDAVIPQIKGVGTSTELKTHAVIGRTNTLLLARAIEYMGTKKYSKIYFEGNLSSYTYAKDGASLYDVLNLYTNNKKYIKDEVIKEMNTFKDLIEYSKEIEDGGLIMMCNIVEEYGRRIPGLIKELKECHVDNKEDADIIFSTVHRSKGMEYDSVELLSDFITDKQIMEILEPKHKGKKGVKTTFENLNEEVNSLYVAITRTRNRLYIPKSIIPELWEENENIYITDPNNFKLDYEAMPWTDDDIADLNEMCEKLYSVKSMSTKFRRSERSIRTKIKELEIEYGV